ncbi:MAG: DUF1559 domain-containing protein, partial [Candidatus Omnitrophica bacterium]|nr:DUF1559 domain-containing protein [Candidatus Omnitrophota bacterium]
LSQARDRARQATCTNNLKQLGLALLMYSGDYDEWILPGSTTYPNWWDNSQRQEPWFCLLGNLATAYGGGGKGTLDYGIIMRFGGAGSKGMGCPAQTLSWAYSDYTANYILVGSAANGVDPSLGPKPHKLSAVYNSSIAPWIMDNGRGGYVNLGVSDGAYYEWAPEGNNDQQWRHNNKKYANILYVDGHVVSKTKAEMSGTFGAGFNP